MAALSVGKIQDWSVGVNGERVDDGVAQSGGRLGGSLGHGGTVGRSLYAQLIVGCCSARKSGGMLGGVVCAEHRPVGVDVRRRDETRRATVGALPSNVRALKVHSAVKQNDKNNLGVANVIPRNLQSYVRSCCSRPPSALRSSRYHDLHAFEYAAKAGTNRSLLPSNEEGVQATDILSAFLTEGANLSYLAYRPIV